MLRSLGTGVLGLAIAGVLAVSARADTVTTTATLFGEKWEWVSEGTARTWFPSTTHSLEVSGTRDWIEFDLRGGPPEYEPFQFVFAAPVGQPLAPGVYASAEDAFFRPFDRPGLYVGGDGRGCNLPVGNFEVRELAWGPDGLERAWILWENHCDPRGPAGFGEIPEPGLSGLRDCRLRLNASGSKPPDTALIGPRRRPHGPIDSRIPAYCVHTPAGRSTIQFRHVCKAFGVRSARRIAF